MISKNYSANYSKCKNMVINHYEIFEKTMEKLGYEIDNGIKADAEKIKKDVFKIMILGEAKSGKSTFINAYLGTEIVPMDVQQCTSAIIKIDDGNEFRLIAKQADGNEVRVQGEATVKKFLKEQAAINNEYRDIPVSAINNELLIPFNIHEKKISKKDIQNFEDKYKGDNVNNIKDEDYKELIEKYIEGHSQKWKEIITEISIKCPLPEEMKEYSFIDSPGVGASGDVGKVTEDYINEADAIIFVKALSGQALESAAFKNFFNNKCTAKRKEMLFVVLTRKSDFSNSEIARLREQAKRMFGNSGIEEGKIILVDSKVHLVLNRCKKIKTTDPGETEKNITHYFEDEDNQFDPAEKIWLKLNGDFKEFEIKMNEKSSFYEVEDSLCRFGKTAKFNRLKNFLDIIRTEYETKRAGLEEVLKTANEGEKSPENFDNLIAEKMRETSKIYNKINKGIEEITKRYKNLKGDGVINSQANDLQQKYEKELKRFQSMNDWDISDSTFDQLKTITMDAINDVGRLKKNLAEQLISDCNKELINLEGNTTQKLSVIYKPNFSEKDFNDLNEKAKNDSQKREVTKKGGCFSSDKYGYVYHKKEHIKLVTNGIINRLKGDIVPELKNDAQEYTNSCIDMYKEKLDNRHKELQEEYEKLHKEKDNIVRKIDEYKNNISLIKKNTIELGKALEEI